MKIAVVGSGISGLSAAHLLSTKYDVYIFEKNNRLGGHTRTINVYESSKKIPIEFNIETRRSIRPYQKNLYII